MQNLFIKHVLPAILFLIAINASAQDFSALTIGDSLTAGLSATGGGEIRCAALGNAIIAADQQRSCRGNGQINIGGWQPTLHQLSDGDTFNFGNSGERTSEMVGRLASHLNARSSKYVLILGGTNDVIAGISEGITIQNIQTMINAATAAGRIPIVGTIPPLRGGRFNSLEPRVISLNRAILALENVLIADHYAALVGNWGRLNSGDSIHLGAGNAVVANTWFERMSFVPEPKRQPLSSVTLLLLDEE